MSTRRLGWLFALASVVGCGGDDFTSTSTSTSMSTSPSTSMSTSMSIAMSSSTSTSASIKLPAACSAPSLLALTSRDDARSLSILETCPADDTFSAMAAREQPIASHCGMTGPAADIERVLESALPLDAATASHVRTVFAEGQKVGRRADVFGLVGDSITVHTNFMTPFGVGSGLRIVLAPEVRDGLAIEPDADGRPRTIIDWFRGVSAWETLDSFRAPRAAKVGERAPWALQPRWRASPLDEMVTMLSPAFAVVMYGTNDAALRAEAPDAIAARFESGLGAIVDALEAQGVVPVLTTIPKHMHDSRFADCSTEGQLTNERLMVQTNVVSAAVARMACERALPLVDLRYAIDGLLNRGVGGDGVHPTVYALGGGVLDANGLACGLNARNLATLRMLKQLHDVVGAVD